MTEYQWKALWSVLICAGLFALIVVVEIQQIWVKHRPVETAPSSPERTIVQPKTEAAFRTKPA
jgi:hypothetical protein